MMTTRVLATLLALAASPAVALAIPAPALGAVNTFTGSVSDKWNTAGNWSDGEAKPITTDEPKGRR